MTSTYSLTHYALVSAQTTFTLGYLSVSVPLQDESLWLINSWVWMLPFLINSIWGSWDRGW